MADPTNLQYMQRAAKKLGLKAEYVANAHKKQLLISHQKKFFLASASAPGLYPAVSRWNAHFSGSKSLTQKLLKRLGYRVLKSWTINVREYRSHAQLQSYLSSKKWPFPLLTKPDKGLQGQNIIVCENNAQLIAAAKKYRTRGLNFLLQPILDQNEYRILVVNNQVVLMHSKHKPTVTGDGTRTVAELLATIPDAKKDMRHITQQYTIMQVRPNTVLEHGQKFEYHLTRKPTTEYYETEHFPKATTQWALALAKVTNMPVVGIDIFIPGAFSDTASYTIIELNSNPGVNYLKPFCNDDHTPQNIFERVLKQYFNLK